jgi:hypothetical protein
MTDRSKGILWIGGGIFALLVAFNLIIEGVFLLLGVWMVSRGLRMRGLRPLSERMQKYVEAFKGIV